MAIPTATSPGAPATQQVMPSGSMGGSAIGQPSQSAMNNEIVRRYSSTPAPTPGRTMQGQTIPGTSQSVALDQYKQQVANPQETPWYAQQQGPGLNTPGGFQTSFDTGPAVDMSRIDPASMPVSSVGQADPYLRNVQDAYYQQAASRLDPRFGEMQRGLESQLAAQGLTKGSQAWNQEMERLGRERNDAYGAATRESILTSGQEAQRLQGMDIAGGEFANKAAQTDWQNKMAERDAWNRAQQQGFTQNQAAAQFGNQALSEQQRTAQGWGGLAQQRYQTEQQTMGQMAGVEAQRYGTEQQYQTGLGNQKAMVAAANATAGGMVGAAQASAGATVQAAQIRAQTDARAQELQRYGMDQSNATRIAEMESRQNIAGMQDTTTQRGQDISADTARYGYDTSKANTAYTADRSYDLGMRGLQQNQQQQDWNIAKDIYGLPLQTQNALMAGNQVAAPTYNDFNPAAYPSQGNSSGYAAQVAAGNNQAAAGTAGAISAAGTFGGNYLYPSKSVIPVNWGGTAADPWYG